jgi:Leucine Rich repeat
MTEPTRHRPRWLRFSLRTLLVMMTVLCVWLGIQVNAARRQKQAVEAILKAGGSVNYTYQLRPDADRFVGPGFSMFPCARNASIPGPTWLRKLIGDDYFRTAFQVQIALNDEDSSKAAIRAIANLPTIRCVSLIVRERDSKVQDSVLAPLGRLTKLERLSLRDTQVSGEFLSQLDNPAGMVQLSITGLVHNIDDAAMAQIGKMTNLEVLDLLNCNQVTDAGLVHLSKLTSLKVVSLQFFGRITDAGLKHLAGLNRLTDVFVGGGVTANGIRELQLSLPNTLITGPR